MSTTETNELRSLLADTTEKTLSGMTGDFAARWSQIEETGLAGVLVPEAQGGFGGTFSDALIVVRQSGLHATALPLAEAVLAGKLIADAGLAVPAGAISVAAAATGVLSGQSFTGTLSQVPYGRDVKSVATIVESVGKPILVLASVKAASDLQRHDSGSGEPRDTLNFKGAQVEAAPLLGWSAERLFAAFAMLRAAQIAGALEGARNLSVAYTRERVQFGKPLASFQAIQQQLAVLAEEAAASDMASAAAFAAADKGEALLEIACAKLRANKAAGIGAAIAHQVHGAMGFTAEYALNHLTRRLWAWRGEFGNERHWADIIGTKIASRGADMFWSDLTAQA